MPEQITQLNNQTVDQFVKDNQNKLIVMVFAAEWCGHCRNFAPTFAKISQKNPHVNKGQAVLARLDVDEAGQAAATWKVEVLPSIIFIKNGQEVERLIGNQEQQMVEELISQHLN